MTQTIVNVPAASGGFDPTDITLTDNTSGAFLIKEGSNEYMRIDTTDTQEKTTFTTQSGANTGFFVSVPTVGDVFSIIRGGSPSTRASIGTGVTLFQVDSDKILNDLISDAKTFKVDGTSVSPLVITGDSNTTVTLDHGSGATFKVVDDNASPRTFIQITEGSNTRCLIPTLSFNEIKNASAGRVMQLTTSNGIAIERTPLSHIGSGSLTYDQSHDGTAIDIGTTPSFTVVYSSAASAAATSGITLQVTATDFQDGCVAPQYLVLQNQNSTHSAKFILDPIGDFAAKETATTGTDAADLIGSGFTLAAGKMAVFTLLACRVRDTGSHYFYCVSLHTKT